MNRNYLDHIRKNSFYPAFRDLVQFLTVFGYIAAGLTGLSAFLTEEAPDFLLCLLATPAIVFLVTVAKESSLMLADIADATINFAGSQPDAFKSEIGPTCGPKDSTEIDEE